MGFDFNKLSRGQKAALNRLYDVISKCDLWTRSHQCKAFDGKTCLRYRYCPILRAYDEELIRLSKTLRPGEWLPYLPGRIDYSGNDRHILIS